MGNNECRDILEHVAGSVGMVARETPALGVLSNERVHPTVRIRRVRQVTQKHKKRNTHPGSGSRGALGGYVRLLAQSNKTMHHQFPDGILARKEKDVTCLLFHEPPLDVRLVGNEEESTILVIVSPERNTATHDAVYIRP